MSVHLITGPMFAGKTSLLLSLKKESDREGVRSILVKSILDNRYNSDLSVETHDGAGEIGDIKCGNLSQVIESPSFPDSEVIYIDEGQFFESIDVFANKISREYGKKVVIAAISTYHDCKPFKNISSLMTHCDKITVVQGKCQICQKPSIYHVRKPGGSVIGGADSYYPVCRFHHPSGFRKSLDD